VDRHQVRRDVLKPVLSSQFSVSASASWALPFRPLRCLISGMRLRWRLILPSCGLLLFAILTYQSIAENRAFHNSRYVWWSALRLDSDPLNRHSATRTANACPDKAQNCIPVEPIEIWIDPGWVTKCFMFLALPAFLGTAGIVSGLARLDVSEITSFFVSMPFLTVAWFYFIGWMFDRWHGKRERT
jgi:hypothetical protein